METLEQMLKMDGATGSEDIVFSPTENMIYSLAQWQEMIESYAAKKPKAALKFEKTGIRQVRIWIWKYDTCRFAPFHTLYKTRIRFENLISVK